MLLGIDNIFLPPKSASLIYFALLSVFCNGANFWVGAKICPSSKLTARQAAGGSDLATKCCYRGRLLPAASLCDAI